MKRRTYLAALAAAPAAGCVDGVGSARTLSPVAPEGVQRLLRLESDDDAGGDVRIEAEVVEPSVTAEHPARVRVTTTNEGPERDVTVAPGQCCLFNRNGGASDPSGLWLHREGIAEHVERDGDRWTRDAPADEKRAYAMYGCLPKTFEADESVTNEYHVWDDYRAEGYYQPGTYRFAEPVTVAEAGSGLYDEDDEDAVVAEFTWGFSLRVERP